MLSAVLVGLATLSTVEGQAAQFDDEKVIQAAMLSQIANPETQKHWKESDAIVMDPKWVDQSRPSFHSLLEEAVESERTANAHAHGAEITTLKPWEKILLDSKGTSEPAPPLIDLPQMTLDRRIVVGVLQKNRFFEWYGSPVIGLKPERLTRLSYGLEPPCYSRNGMYAIVHGWTRWSMHSADVKCLLIHQGNTWKALKTFMVYYC